MQADDDLEAASQDLTAILAATSSGLLAMLWLQSQLQPFTHGFVGHSFIVVLQHLFFLYAGFAFHFVGNMICPPIVCY